LVSHEFHLQEHDESELREALMHGAASSWIYLRVVCCPRRQHNRPAPGDFQPPRRLGTEHAPFSGARSCPKSVPTSSDIGSGPGAPIWPHPRIAPIWVADLDEWATKQPGVGSLSLLHTGLSGHAADPRTAARCAAATDVLYQLLVFW